MRLYGMMTTFALALNISGQLIWNLCPKLDIIEVLVWAVFIAVGASMAFVALTEPKRKRRARWMTSRNGLNVLVQGRETR